MNQTEREVTGMDEDFLGSGDKITNSQGQRRNRKRASTAPIRKRIQAKSISEYRTNGTPSSGADQLGRPQRRISHTCNAY